MIGSCWMLDVAYAVRIGVYVILIKWSVFISASSLMQEYKIHITLVGQVADCRNDGKFQMVGLIINIKMTAKVITRN